MKKNALSLMLFAAFALCAFGAAELTLDGGPLSDPNAKTTILSQTLEMVSSDTANTFYFSKNVRVRSTNLFMTADKMVVTALRENSEASAIEVEKTAKTAAAKRTSSTSANTPLGTIDKIVATGNVNISQQDREATAGHAEFFPKEGRVVLTENPRVVDSKAIVSGWRITLLHGERRVLVEQDPNGTTRPNVDLNELPDMSVTDEPKAAASETSAPAAAPTISPTTQAAQEAPAASSPQSAPAETTPAATLK